MLQYSIIVSFYSRFNTKYCFYSFLHSIRASDSCSEFISDFLKLNNGFLFNFFEFFNKCDESATPFKHGQYDDCQVRKHELYNMEVPNFNGFGNLFTLWITGRTSIDSWEVLERSFWCFYYNSESRLLTLEFKGESFAYIHEFHSFTFNLGSYSRLPFAIEVWKVLENRFSSISRSHIMNLKGELHNLKKEAENQSS